MADSRNESLGITNQTSNQAIFASAFAIAPGQDGYAQQLSAFPNNAKPTIITGNSGAGNITLDKTYDDHGTQKPILIYDLIGMKPDNLFPLFDQSATPQDCTDHPSPKCQGGKYTTYYDDITMAQDQADGMLQSYQFNQNISAYPEVDISKTFLSILNEYASDPVKLEQEVNQFFKTQTKTCQKCTLATYIAASTYSQQFAFAWAGLQSSYTYYVFAVSQDTRPTAQGFSKIGTIVFTRKSDAPNPADVSDANGGYTISYLPDGKAARPLTLVNANLVTASNPDFPDVSMLLAFALKSAFTGNANDNVVWPIMAGKIDGFNVVAVGQDSSTPSSWYEFFHPKTAQQWMGLIGSIIGISFALYFLVEKGYQLLKWFGERRARDGRLPDRGEIERRQAEINREMRDVPSAREQLLERSGINSRIPDDYGSFASEASVLQQSRLQVNYEMQVAAFDGAIGRQRQSIAELAQVENTRELKEAVGALVESRQALDGVRNLRDLDSVRRTLNTNLSDVHDTITNVTKEFAGELGQEAVKQIEARQRLVEQVRDSIKEMNEREAFEEEGKLPVEEL